MVKQVSFTTGTTPAAPQISPLVAALLKQSLDTSQIRSPIQGLDKLGKAALAAFLKRKDEEAAKTKQDEADAKQAALVQNLLGAFAAQQGTAGQIIPAEVAARSPDVPARSELNIPGTPGDPNAIAKALIGGGQIEAGLTALREDAAQRETRAEAQRGRDATLDLQNDRQEFTTGQDEIKASADLAAVLAGQKFQTGERVAGQEFKTGERLGSDTFTLNQRKVLAAALEDFQNKERISREDITAANIEGRAAEGAANRGSAENLLGTRIAADKSAASFERAGVITDKEIFADAVKANQDANRTLTASESTKAQKAASDLAADRPVTVSPGQVVTRGGKVIFTAKDKDVRVKLSPGDRLLSGTGAVIAIAPSSPKPPATRTIKRGPDFITQEFNEKTGQYEDVETAPRFGRTAEDLEGLAPLSPLVPSDTADTRGVPLSEATGGSGFLGSILNSITEAFGLDLNSPEVAKGTAALNRLMVETTTLLASEVTGRPSKFILEQIQKLQAEPGKIFQGDERSRIKLEVMRDFVADKRDSVKSEVSLNSLKRPQQGAAIVKLQSLDRLVATYDEVLAKFGGDNAPTQEDLEFTAREEGISVDEVKRQLGLQ